MSAFLIGKDIYLRGISRQDINETYLSWLNDPKITKGLVSGTYPTSLEQLSDYVDAQLRSDTTVMFAICTQAGDKHIGNIKIDQFNWIARTCELGILIGDQEEWGKGYGRQACEMVLQYAFETLNMRKVTLVVFSNNPGAKHLYEKLGFELEGTLKDHLYIDGAWVDKLYMSKFR